MDVMTQFVEANSGTALGVGFLGGTFVGMAITIAIIVYVLLVIAMWKIFTKAGEKGWKSLIPVYNAYIMFKIIWSTKMFWVTFAIGLIAGALQGIFPTVIVSAIVSLVFAIAILVIDIKYCNRMSKSFGHGNGYAIGLFFLPNIFHLIIGFGKSEYKKIEE